MVYSRQGYLSLLYSWSKKDFPKWNTITLNFKITFFKDGDAYVRHSACEALTSLLPLSYCGQDIALTSSQYFIQVIIIFLKFNFKYY